MIEDLQKASLLKRFSAYLLDVILLAVLITGIAALLSFLLGYEAEGEKLSGYFEQYSQEFQVEMLSQGEYDALTDEARQEYDKVYAEMMTAMNENNDAVICYNKVINYTFLIVIGSILFGYLLLEFAVPLLLKNGQTVGKKVFSLAVVRIDCVRVSTLQMFVRTVLGKCTVGTLVPAMALLSMQFGTANIVIVLVLLAIILIQFFMIVITNTNSAIHDRMASTVVVDMPSQMIFDSAEHLLEYKKQRHKEVAEDRPYF